MKNTKQALLTLSMMCLTSTQAMAGGASKIPCSRSLAGTWAFGTAPVACALDTKVASEASVRAQYAPVIYSDKLDDRERFMSELYPFVRDMASNYLHRRNPKVSAAEEEGFLHAIYALANQESYWSHYREGKDGLLRFMRGDSGHGFGMMQLDDRSHIADIRQGKAQDLAYLIVMGLDIYYSAWVKSAKAKCVPSSTDYHSRARAAWSAYNGGEGQICRWSNSRSTYHRFDTDFNSRYTGMAWRPFVRDVKANSKLNAKCLAEGKRPCALASSK